PPAASSPTSSAPWNSCWATSADPPWRTIRRTAASAPSCGGCWASPRSTTPSCAICTPAAPRCRLRRWRAIRRRPPRPIRRCRTPCWRCIAASRSRPRCASGWSISTRACRSGNTAMSSWWRAQSAPSREAAAPPARPTCARRCSSRCSRTCGRSGRSFRLELLQPALSDFPRGVHRRLAGAVAALPVLVLALVSGVGEAAVDHPGVEVDAARDLQEAVQLAADRLARVGGVLGLEPGQAFLVLLRARGVLRLPVLLGHQLRAAGNLAALPHLRDLLLGLAGLCDHLVDLRVAHAGLLQLAALRLEIGGDVVQVGLALGVIGLGALVLLLQVLGADQLQLGLVLFPPGGVVAPEGIGPGVGDGELAGGADEGGAGVGPEPAQAARYRGVTVGVGFERGLLHVAVLEPGVADRVGRRGGGQDQAEQRGAARREAVGAARHRIPQAPRRRSSSVWLKIRGAAADCDITRAAPPPARRSGAAAPRPGLADSAAAGKGRRPARLPRPGPAAVATRGG